MNCLKRETEISSGSEYFFANGRRQSRTARPGSVRAVHHMDDEISPDGTLAPAPPEPEAMPQVLSPVGPEIMEQEPDAEPPAPELPVRFTYAGLWLRLAAYLIDSALLGTTVLFALFTRLMNSGAIPADNPWIIWTSTSRQYVALQALVFMIQWIYFALFESSKWQASPGKKLLGLKVTDLEGKRISFARASARYFATILSSFILLAGFIMIAFTQKKQGLHDILTGCLVIKEK